MAGSATPTAPRESGDHDRLADLGYRQELSRVLSLFDNFSVAFSYLSPMVGVYSLFVLGAGRRWPALPVAHADRRGRHAAGRPRLR